MGSLLKLKSLLSIALGLFALQAVATSAHSVQHLSWTRIATEVSRSRLFPLRNSDKLVVACRDKLFLSDYTSSVKPFDDSIKTPRPASAKTSPITPEACAALLLETAPRVMRAVRLAMAALEAPPLTIPQYRALKFVQDHEGASLSATAEFLDLTLPSTSKLVDQLVRRSMLVRDDASDDRRRMNLRITAKGDALLKNAEATVRRHLAGMLTRLGTAELGSLYATLGILQESFPSYRLTAAQNSSGGNAKEPRDAHAAKSVRLASS